MLIRVVANEFLIEMLSLEKDCVILRKDPDEDPNWAAERPVSPGQRRKYANVAKIGCSLFGFFFTHSKTSPPCPPRCAGAPTLGVPRCMLRPLRTLLRATRPACNNCYPGSPRVNFQCRQPQFGRTIEPQGIRLGRSGGSRLGRWGPGGRDDLRSDNSGKLGHVWHKMPRRRA